MQGRLVLPLFGFSLLVGCMGETKRMAPDQFSDSDLGTGITSQDLRSVAQRITQSLITLPQIQNAKTPPKVGFLTLGNNFSGYIDPDMFLNTIRTEIIKHTEDRVIFLDRVILDDTLKLKENRHEARGKLTTSDFILSGIIEYIGEVAGKGSTTYVRLSLRLTDASNSAIFWKDDYIIKYSQRDCRNMERTTKDIFYVDEKVDLDDPLFQKAKEWIKKNIATLNSLKDKEIITLCNDMLSRLEKSGKSAITTIPNPYLAYVFKKKDKSAPLVLTIDWLERDADLISICIREYGPGGQVITETYELHMKAILSIRDKVGLSWAHSFSFIITERTDPTQQKDQDGWRNWLLSNNLKQPAMYLARPTKDVHVLISLINSAGNESRWIPVSCWIDETEAAPVSTQTQEARTK